MTLLFTGFPGFLGSSLLPRVLARTDDTAICVVQAAHVALAQQRVAQLADSDSSLARRIKLVTGDITRPRLGLDEPDALTADVTEVWHLAAVYDVAVSRDVGIRVNVEGTRYVLDLAMRCPRLERVHHFSTCYVSGRYTGPFSEDDLEVDAPFNNHYEETKHLAEAEVRARMDQGVPVTIYRPSVVLGDSRTGETQKFDGLYFLFKLLLRQPHRAVLPVFHDPTAYRANFVPRDYVIDAIAYLSALPGSIGRTYHLADPRPLTVAELYDVLGEATGRRIALLPLPEGLTRTALGGIPRATALIGMPAELVDYFVHPTHYTTGKTRADLAGSGITCPRFPDYAAVLVDYMRRHGEITSAAMT